MNSKLSVAAIAVAAVSFFSVNSAQAQGPAPIWNGVYAGIQVGGGWSRLTGDDIDVKVDPSGLIAGGHLGANFQSGSAVFGLEGSLNASGMSWSKDGTKVTNGYLGTLRARAGIASGPALFYATGGAAFTSLKVADSTESLTKSSTGWVAGLGAEYKINANWSGRAEWLHHKHSYSFDGSTARQPINTLTVGLSYKF